MAVTRTKKLKAKRKEPVWKGPCKDGVTQSLLAQFLVCRERFRILVVEGLKVHDTFSPAIEYGSMWHVCEEAYAADEPWPNHLLVYARWLAKKYPLQQEEVEKWYQVCKRQFPIYVKYWGSQPVEKDARVVAKEYTFCEPYTLPSGRVVKLRGKFDRVDMFKHKKRWRIRLQENKSKGDLDEGSLTTRLMFDIQTMMYTVALECALTRRDSNLRNRVGGASPVVRHLVYNVIRRPLSGGKGTIRPHKATKNKPAETMPEFYQRLVDDYLQADPDYYFMRLDSVLSDTDVHRFKAEFLDPILEQLCDWWEWIAATHGEDPWREDDYGRAGGGVHFRFPYGVYSPLFNNRATDIDEYIMSGSTVGLERVDNLYPEL